MTTPVYTVAARAIDNAINTHKISKSSRAQWINEFLAHPAGTQAVLAALVPIPEFGSGTPEISNRQTPDTAADMARAYEKVVGRPPAAIHQAESDMARAYEKVTGRDWAASTCGLARCSTVAHGCVCRDGAGATPQPSREDSDEPRYEISADGIGGWVDAQREREIAELDDQIRARASARAEQQERDRETRRKMAMLPGRGFYWDESAAQLDGDDAQ